MATKRKLLDGLFYLQKRMGCTDRRMKRSMVVTKEYPLELNIDYDKLGQNEDGSWNVHTTEHGIKVAVPGESYWMVYHRPGEEPIIDILEKGSLPYYDYNVCSESGVVIGALSVIDGSTTGV